jgi:CRP/FNR family transcriptional regulator, cyclic AMP receptor protein
MQETVLKQIPCDTFFVRLKDESLFEGFARYLAVRIADQQQIIANLVTVDSEQRLGKTLQWASAIRTAYVSSLR